MATKVPTGVYIDHEAGTDRSLFAKWTWGENHTDHYEVWWEYSTANVGVWFTGSESSEKHNISQYSYPENASTVRFRVKPVAENKSGGDTPYWTSAWTIAVTYKVPKKVAESANKTLPAVTDVTLELEGGTDRTYHAFWTWKADNTEYIAARWMYYVAANKQWFFGTTEYVTDEAEFEDTWQSAWTAPANATKVRCQVKPQSTVAWESDERINYHWTTYWSEWEKKSISDGGAPAVQDAPNPSKPDIQNGTDRTLYVTWIWDKSKTDHYYTRWQYATGDRDQDNKLVWYEGSTSDVKVKNATYTAPDNAIRVRFWVKAFAETGATWSESATSRVVYYDELTPVAAGTPKAPNIRRQRSSETELIATWEWTQAQTDHFEVEWRYSAGDQNPTTKAFVYHSNGVQTVPVSGSFASTYTPPSNATRVQCRVRPIPIGSAFTSGWSRLTNFTYSEQLKAATKSKKKVSGIAIQLESGSDRNLIATWDWAEKNTASYNVSWQYSTGQGIWFYGKRNESVDHLYDTYSAPANATRVRFYVRPIAKTHKVQGIDTPYWKADTSATKYYSFIDSGEPSQAPTPTVTIDGLKLTAEVDIYDSLADIVEFNVVKNDSISCGIYKSRVVTNHAAVSCEIALGGEYKVRARAVNEVRKNSSVVERGEWSEYSTNVGTVPTAPKAITRHKTYGDSEIELTWKGVDNVTGYEIEYTTDKRYFDTSDQTTTVSVSGTGTTYSITGLETGRTYFFRVRAINDAGNSVWTPDYKNNGSYSVVLGTRPSPPTTWSDTTTGVIGDNLFFYWIHNSEDESVQTDAEIELTINGQTITVEPTYKSDGDIPSYYIFNTINQFNGINCDIDEVSDSVDDVLLDSDGNEILGVSEFSYGFEGAVVVWRVRTKGVVNSWSDWSAGRTVIIYAQPIVHLYVGNDPEFIETIYEINRYPMLIHAEALPLVQNAIGFNVSIIANESYETVDEKGMRKNVRDQEAVFEKYYPATNGNVLDVSLTAGDVTLDDEITYTVTVTAAMDSSLTADSSWTLIARWDGDILVPDAEVTVNPDTLSAYIRPFCNDEDGELIDGVYLSVYRIEYDGRLVLLAERLRNGEITITDPHPSLNYARYRVTATYEETGLMGFRDIPGTYIGETGIVVQWDEEWQPFFTDDGAYEDPLVETTDAGSILKLPYNIEVSDSNDLDVALNEYIGRAHPVSYYGTQLGVKGSWNGTIRRDDIETIYALRRLAVYRGDVYVREPSGVGYWANVTVSFSKRYNEMVIPVTLNVTRVEGGV